MLEELECLRAENAHLRELLRRHEGQVSNDESSGDLPCGLADTAPQRVEQPRSRSGASAWEAGPHDLSAQQIARYSRQLILPSFGVAGAPLLRFL